MAAHRSDLCSRRSSSSKCTVQVTDLPWVNSAHRHYLSMHHFVWLDVYAWLQCRWQSPWLFVLCGVIRKRSGWQSQIFQSIYIYLNQKRPPLNKKQLYCLMVKNQGTSLCATPVTISPTLWFPQQPPDHHSNGPNTTQADLTFEGVLSLYLPISMLSLSMLMMLIMLEQLPGQHGNYLCLTI